MDLLHTDFFQPNSELKYRTCIGTDYCVPGAPKTNALSILRDDCTYVPGIPFCCNFSVEIKARNHKKPYLHKNFHSVVILTAKNWQ